MFFLRLYSAVVGSAERHASALSRPRPHRRTPQPNAWCRITGFALAVFVGRHTSQPASKSNSVPHAFLLSLKRIRFHTQTKRAARVFIYMRIRRRRRLATTYSLIRRPADTNATHSTDPHPKHSYVLSQHAIICWRTNTQTHKRMLINANALHSTVTYVTHIWKSFSVVVVVVFAISFYPSLNTQMRTHTFTANPHF